MAAQSTADLPLPQARWAASQAALLLREHGRAYVHLCDALTAGESVGACIAAIERGLDEESAEGRVAGTLWGFAYCTSKSMCLEPGSKHRIWS